LLSHAASWDDFGWRLTRLSENGFYERVFTSLDVPPAAGT
jgi:hypothetical protein